MRFFHLQRFFVATVCALFLCCAARVARAQNADAPDSIKGTIVSLRGNILVVCPELRPVPERVAFDDSTLIVFYGRTTGASLAVGQRVAVNGNYTVQNGLQPRFVEVTDVRIPDDAGEDFSFDSTPLRGVWRARVGDRNALLIGTRISVGGKTAPDGVTAAKFIYPERGQSPFGTMFGTIHKTDGDKIQIRPRFTQDTFDVKLEREVRIQREKRFEAETIKAGSNVTFWGEMRPVRGDPRNFDLRAMSDFKALVLLLGDGRYPVAQGEGAPIYITGKIVSLNSVHLRKPDKTLLSILPTAQMPIV